MSPALSRDPGVKKSKSGLMRSKGGATGVQPDQPRQSKTPNVTFVASCFVTFHRSGDYWG